MEKRTYASYLEDNLPIPVELPDGELAERVKLRRLTAKERRQLATSYKQDLELLRAKIRMQIVEFGPISAPIPPEILDNLDTLNEDFLIEAQAAIDRGFATVSEFTSAVAEGKEQPFR